MYIRCRYIVNYLLEIEYCILSSKTVQSSRWWTDSWANHGRIDSQTSFVAVAQLLLKIYSVVSWAVTSWGPWWCMLYWDYTTQLYQDYLGGGSGNSFFLFMGKMSNLTHIFQMGWNHQLVMISQLKGSRHEPIASAFNMCLRHRMRWWKWAYLISLHRQTLSAFKISAVQHGKIVL